MPESFKLDWKYHKIHININQEKIGRKIVQKRIKSCSCLRWLRNIPSKLSRFSVIPLYCKFKLISWYYTFRNSKDPGSKPLLKIKIFIEHYFRFRKKLFTILIILKWTPHYTTVYLLSIMFDSVRKSCDF